MAKINSIPFTLEKIANIVKNGVKDTQKQLCHAKTANWIANNLNKNSYSIVLWGDAGSQYVFHSAILTPDNELEMSYYSGAPDHKLLPNLDLLLDNGEVLKMLYKNTIGNFKNYYLKLEEDTNSADLNIRLATVSDTKLHKNREIEDKTVYNKPDLNIKQVVQQFRQNLNK